MEVASINMDTDIMTWVDVCGLDDLVDNIGVCTLIDDTQIAIFKLSGCEEIFAIDNHDPFSDANVLSRGVVGDLKGQLVVASPIYKQHFNLQTGQCLEDESISLKTYPTRIVDNIVQVGMI